MKRIFKRRGVALVWMAVIGLVLITFMGLAIDTAWVYSVDQQLQVAADSAALSAAVKLTAGGTTAQVQNAAAAAAAANKAGGVAVSLDYTAGTNDETKDVVLGQWITTATPPYFQPGIVGADSVQVKARRTNYSLFFGPIVGVGTASSAATAIGHAGVEGTGAGVLILGHTGIDLNMSNATMQVGTASGNGAGLIWINSTATGSNAAAKISSNSHINYATDLYVVGGTNPSPIPTSSFAGVQHTGADPLPDPLINLPEPTTVGMTVFPTKPAAGTINPGWYQQGIKLSGGTLTMNPGIYYVDSNTGFDMNNTTVIANNVLIFVKSGPFKFPSGNITLSPPTSGTYQGVSIFTGRTSPFGQSGGTGGGGVTLNGSGTVTLNGAMYFPDSLITITGGNGGVQSTGNQIIASQITMSAGVFNLYYNVQTAFKSTGGNNKVYLVK